MLNKTFALEDYSANHIMRFESADFAETCIWRLLKYPTWAVMNWSHSSPWTPTVHYMVNWRQFTLIWIYSQPTAWCILFLLRPVLRMIFGCTFSAMFLVAAVVGLRWPEWCVRSCCVRSVSNGSGPSFRGQVRVQTEPLPNWWSGLSIIPNHQLE